MGRLQAGGVPRFKLIARQRSLALWFADELGNQGLEFRHEGSACDDLRFKFKV